MKLVEFRIKNYRSVNDSGAIKVGQQTALVGRNESGKTNLLLALESLNPSDKPFTKLSFEKDFPRDRPESEFSGNRVAVETRWQLSQTEQSNLVKIFPRAQGVSEVTINRLFDPVRRIGFVDISPLQVEAKLVKQFIGSLNQMTQKFELPSEVQQASSELVNALSGYEGVDPKNWAEAVGLALKNFSTQISATGTNIPEKHQAFIPKISSYINAIQQDDELHKKAREWIVQQMPIFIYLDEYPELRGHQDIPEFIDKKGRSVMGPAERNFDKLVKVAGLDPQKLQQLLNDNHETRQLLANRAGAVVTQKIRQLWTDRPLKVRFNLDGKHFDTLISDPTNTYDVEVNFDERSRGFKWFFSFYITFAADTAGGQATNAILLLDEPGLYLHATAQKDLLQHFRDDFHNQIIYTTHSPFMIPVDDISAIRTVNISQETATQVTNDPTGDEKTLFPLQTALGYEAAQSLFIGEKNLVVEGISDFWYLNSVSEYLKGQGGVGLPEGLITTPAGGAQKVTYMVSLLTSHRLKVLALFDDEHQARNTADELVKQKLIRDENVIFVSEALGTTTKEADVEDLLDTQTFDDLVQQAYKTELHGITLNLNSRIPRIVRRYEDAFKKSNLEFNKTRVARLFIQQIGVNPSKVMTPITQRNFETLFSSIASKLTKMLSANREPFR